MDGSSVEALSEAVAAGDPLLVRAILQLVTDPNALNSRGRTAIQVQLRDPAVGEGRADTATLGDTEQGLLGALQVPSAPTRPPPLPMTGPCVASVGKQSLNAAHVEAANRGHPIITTGVDTTVARR